MWLVFHDSSNYSSSCFKILDSVIVSVILCNALLFYFYVAFYFFHTSRLVSSWPCVDLTKVNSTHESTRHMCRVDRVSSVAHGFPCVRHHLSTQWTITELVHEPCCPLGNSTVHLMSSVTCPLLYYFICIGIRSTCHTDFSVTSWPCVDVVCFLLCGLVIHGMVWHIADFQTIPNDSIAQLIQWRFDCLCSYDLWRVDW